MKKSITLFSTDQRGEAYTLGTILIISMATVATVSSAAVGVLFINESQELSRQEGAVNAMTELDSQLSLIALEGGTQQSNIPIGLSNNEKITIRDTGQLTVRTIDPTDGSVTGIVLRENIGSIVYNIEGSNTEIVYQGGGVWRADTTNINSTKMVSPPEMHYRGKTLTMPIISLDTDNSGDITGSGQLAAKSQGTTIAYPSPGKQNPIENDQVQIVVESEYYVGWAEFFDKRVSGNIKVDHANQRVIVPLIPETDQPAVTTGMSSTYSGSGVTVRGSGGSASFIDSYDSDSGSYATTQGTDGSLTATSDVKLRGSATIYGDVILPDGYSVDVQGGSQITGDIIRQDVESSAITAEVQSRIDSTETKNDNDGTTAIESNSLNASQSTWELTDGQYYIEEDITISSGETLILDTTAGDVTIGLKGDININGGTIEIKGEGNPDTRASIFMNGNSVDNSGGTVTVADEKSTKFWVYAYPGLDTTISNGAKHVGVVYAPGDGSTGGISEVRSQAEMFGAIVGGEAQLQSGGTIHYDQALGTQRAIPAGEVPVVTYLHVSVNSITVDEGN